MPCRWKKEIQRVSKCYLTRRNFFWTNSRQFANGEAVKMIFSIIALQERFLRWEEKQSGYRQVRRRMRPGRASSHAASVSFRTKRKETLPHEGGANPHPYPNMKDKASAPASLNNNLAISPERRFTVEEVAKAIAAEAIGKGGYRGSEAEAQFAAYVKNILAKTDFVALEEVAQGIERVQEQVNHN